MPANYFNNNEETSLEKGISPNKAVKSVTATAQQQAKAFTNDILAQLYGRSDKSGDDANMTDQQKQDAAKQAQQSTPKPSPKQVHKLGGMSDAGDHAKYAIMQKQLEAGDKKGADNTMHHMQYYYDITVGTLEEQVKKAKQGRQQEEQERQQKEQEEKEKEEEEKQKKDSDVPRANAKGRNRMGQGGKKPKTDMGMKMGQMKTETFRGSSG